MAYNTAYTITWLNRELHTCEVRLKAWDYAEDSAALTGAEEPFVLASNAQDNQIPYGIKATEATVSFYTGNADLFYASNGDVSISSTFQFILIPNQTSDPGIRVGMVLVVAGYRFTLSEVSYSAIIDTFIFKTVETIPVNLDLSAVDFAFYGPLSLETFYSESDTYWLVEFYDNAALQWTGFIQMNNSSEQITDVDHIIILNCNDGLARLQAQYFYDDSIFGGGKPLIVNWTNAELLSYLTLLTGLQLETKAWLNIYENTTEDRTDHDYLTFLTQTAFTTQYFVNNDGTTASLYDALNNFLLDFRCMLTQADGCWQIIRWGDVRLWGDGLMPGTLYGVGYGTYELILFPAAIDIGRQLSHFPINENQQRTLLAPYKYSKETFNYEQPEFIVQNNLQMPVDAVPYHTEIHDDLEYSRYDIPTYFPQWIQRGGIASHNEVVTDTLNQDAEVDRYVVIFPDDALTGGVQFNAIPVTKGDKINFSLRWKTDLDTDDLIRFWVRFVLVTPNDTDYNLQDNAGPSNDQFLWVGPSVSADLWDTGDGIYHELTNPNDIDTTEWMDWSLAASQFTTDPIPLIPTDGMLLIEVRGPNAGSQTDRQIIFFKDITLTFDQFVNNSTQIIGQYHLTEQDPEIRNNEQYQVQFDDSPRRTIKGTLFTSALTDFDYVDVNTGQNTDIGNIYFTPTTYWHRSNIAEARRLGDLNTNNDLYIQQKLRSIVQGDFYGLNGINLLSIINLTWLPNKKFIFGTWTANYMSCVWTANLYELYEDGEAEPDADYTFNYIYDTKK